MNISVSFPLASRIVLFFSLLGSSYVPSKLDKKNRLKDKVYCKFYISLLFLLFMVLSYILVHDEFIESTTEIMKEFNLDNSILSFVVFFLILSVFILFTYPIVITGIFKSDD